jgi:hypothetical protein
MDRPPSVGNLSALVACGGALDGKNNNKQRLHAINGKVMFMLATKLKATCNSILP